MQFIIQKQNPDMPNQWLHAGVVNLDDEKVTGQDGAILYEKVLNEYLSAVGPNDRFGDYLVIDCEHMSQLKAEPTVNVSTVTVADPTQGYPPSS